MLKAFLWLEASSVLQSCRCFYLRISTASPYYFLSCQCLSVCCCLGMGERKTSLIIFKVFLLGGSSFLCLSPDISIAWVESGKRLKYSFISIDCQKGWTILEDYAFLAFPPQSLGLLFPKEVSPFTSPLFCHLSSAAKTNLQLPQGSLLMFVLNTTSGALLWREATLIKLQNSQDLFGFFWGFAFFFFSYPWKRLTKTFISSNNVKKLN